MHQCKIRQAVSLKRLPSGASAPPLILSCLICELSLVLVSAVEFTVSPCPLSTVSSSGEGYTQVTCFLSGSFFRTLGLQPPVLGVTATMQSSSLGQQVTPLRSPKPILTPFGIYPPPPTQCITRTHVHMELLVCVCHDDGSIALCRDSLTVRMSCVKEIGISSCLNTRLK